MAVNADRIWKLFRDDKQREPFQYNSRGMRELAAIIKEIVLQENCVEDTSYFAQLLFLFDSFLLDPYTQELCSRLLAGKSRKRKRQPTVTPEPQEATVPSEPQTAGTGKQAPPVDKEDKEHRDISMSVTRYKQGQHHQAVDFILQSQVVRDLAVAEGRAYPAEGQSIPPMHVNETVLESLMAVEKKTHKDCAPLSIDGKHILTAEAAIMALQTAQIDLNMSVSKERLQKETPPEARKAGRVFCASFLALPQVRIMFVQLLLYVRSTLGPKYSKFLVELQDLSVWVVTRDLSLTAASLEELSDSNYLILAGPE